MILTLDLTTEEFASKRRAAQDKFIARLKSAVVQALAELDGGRKKGWDDGLVAALEIAYIEAYGDEGGSGDANTARFLRSVRPALNKAKADSDPDTVATALAIATINAAALQAASDDSAELVMEWVSMEDDSVRETHEAAHGQVRPIGETFDVGKSKMLMPGDMSAPIEEWINCRCALRPRAAADALVAAGGWCSPSEEKKVEAAEESLEEPTHAGLAVYAADTGRILMIQRSLDQDDPPEVRGTWEFPGGTIEDNETPQETAEREFCEETGLPVPDGEIVNGWRSPNGVYQGFILETPREADAFDELNPDLAAAEMVNPDDPDRRNPDVSAWFTVEQIQNLGPALRPECVDTDWSLFGQQEEDAMTASVAERPTSDDALGVPWHGVWAPEDVWSGDKRKFASGALRHRDLPLPLTWQKMGDDGHKGYVTVAMADDIRMIDGMMHASGIFLQTVPESDEVIGLLSEFGRFGVSVDADEAEFELDENEQGVVFSDAQVCSACIVAIPAFKGAYVTLGKAPWLEEDEDQDKAPADAEEIPVSKDPAADEPDAIKQDAPPLPDDADDDDPEDEDAKGRKQKVPVRSALEQMRLRANRADELDWSDVEQFVDVAPGRTEDGPGWLTHPVDTDRLRDYWVRGPGAAKIGWGTPGDFNRCRAQVAQYVKPQHINGYCANRHFDALGKWPGPGVNRGHSTESIEAFTAKVGKAPAVTLVAAASGEVDRYPAAHFTMAEPGLDDPRVVNDDDGPGVPLTVEDSGLVYGHIARWGACHLDNPEGWGVCTNPPMSASGYREFHQAAAPLDNGTTIPCGVLTVGGGHATLDKNLHAAKEHYDDVSTAAAHVVAIDGEMGIWVCGHITPWATKEQVAMLRSTPVSGDWREDRYGNAEMIAAHAVNTNGFRQPRIKIAASNQHMTAMVASTAPVVPDEAQVAEETMRLIREAVTAQVLETIQARERMAALAERRKVEV
jgi:8-oxo-dGTP pyrophosphatase MutT (NUDIX family)